MSKLVRRLRAPLPVAVLAAVVTAGVTMGAVALAASGDVFYACSKNNEIKPNTIRRNSAPSCAGNEVVVSWNAEGAQGPAGPAGPTGPAGPGTTRIDSLETGTDGTGTIDVVSSDTCPLGSKVVSAFAAPSLNFDISLNGTIAATGPDDLEYAIFGFRSDTPISDAQTYGVTVICEET